METDWAADNLQTIRTLMERSAVYRRALAPIMVWTGVVGSVAGLVGWKLNPNLTTFIVFWSAAAGLAIIGSFLLVRRQALKDSEPFWSPPTRRIAHALLPPLFVGAFVNVFIAIKAWKGVSGPETTSFFGPILVLAWLLLYGCAACSAGFFMTRGMKLFGWLFIVSGCVFLAGLSFTVINVSPSLLMGATFGGLHLAYGIYLYITEKGKNAA
jgi:hypothetical protein